jgi:acyl transferase domain-containing protein/NAD(P)-dependent dehydrogenase (short-subunit alcohol dehydrogenase family)
VLEEWSAPVVEVLAVAAETPEALRAEVEAQRAALAVVGRNLREICRMASRRLARSPTTVGRERLAVVGRSSRAIDQGLAAFLDGARGAAIRAGSGFFDPSGVVFVFPGQGSQWHGMARQLLQSEPVFRTTILACEPHVQSFAGFSLIDELTSSKGASRLDEIEVSLPSIIAVDIAVAAWWRSLGIEPAAVIGHSTGEIAAAHVAGALDLEDTMRIICAYGRFVGRFAGRGAMALVGLPWDEAEHMLRGFEGRVFRAIHDSAAGTVVAGEPSAVAELIATLGAQDVFARRVSMDVAPHCPLVDGVLGELAEALVGIRPRSASVPFISEVTGDEVDGATLDAAHWVKNFGDPARFSEAIDALIRRGHRVFLDVGPHPITKHSIETNLRHAGAPGVVLSSLRRDEDERSTLLDALAELHALGRSPRWEQLYPEGADGVDEGSAWILPLSAKSPAALVALATAHADHLGSGEARLRDVVYTAGVRREHHAQRLAVVGRSRAELSAALNAFASGGVAPGLLQGHKPPAGPPKVVFVFPGQGSQWLGMGRRLLAEEPAFREVIEACERAVAREAGFSLIQELSADEGRSRLDDIGVVQPVIFALQVALAALWRAWGVVPDVVVGHSMGEVAAAHVAGMLDLDDAIRIICRRSGLLRRVAGRGAMGLVELALPEAEAALAGYADRLGIAASNGPRSTVLSGDPVALEEVLTVLEERGVFCRRVKVDVASHSPQMAPLHDDLLAALAEVRPRAGSMPMRSTVLAAPVSGLELDAAYWGRNLRAPVRFLDVARQLIDEGHTVFVEQSPHPVLLPSLEEILAERGALGTAIASTRRGSDEGCAMREALGALYTRGIDVDWSRTGAGGRCVRLPSYPWQRERLWVDAPVAGSRVPGRRAAGEHPLLGGSLVSSLRPGERLWEQRVGAEHPSWLVDHKVQGEVVFPGAAYLEMALAAGAIELGAPDIELAEVRFERMLALPSGTSIDLQTGLVRSSGRVSVAISSRAEGQDGWTRHASAEVRSLPGESAGRAMLAELDARCPRRIDISAHGARLVAMGLRYGPCFAGLEQLAVGEGEALGEVRLPSAIDSRPFHVHPALLDACLQAVMGLVPAHASEGTLVPRSAARVRLHDRVPDRVWVHVRAAAEAESSFDLAILDGEGRLVVEVDSLRLAPLDGARDPLADCAHSVAWRSKAIVPSAAQREGGWLVVRDAGGTGAALATALRGRGEACIEIDAIPVQEFDRRLARELADQRTLRGVVHCASLDAAPWGSMTTATLVEDLGASSLAVVKLTQAILRHGFRDPPRLFLLTRGAQAVGSETVSVAQAPLWGLSRTIALEHPELECTRIDLAPVSRADELDLLTNELTAGDGEDQVALRAEGRFVARLVRNGEPEEQHRSASGRPFAVEIRKPGMLEQLSLREMERRAPGVGEVEIEVEAAGLNFVDVMKALGIAPGVASGPAPLGAECAGRVCAVGDGVSDFVVGSEVIAWVDGAMATHVTVEAAFVVPKPATLTFPEAATILAVYATVHWSLHHVARLSKGERVLIHSASGGTGLAAVRLASAVGAEIFATAGSEEKRAFLRSLGIAHVMDSRSLTFADEIMTITSGRGVDVVLNSLVGDALVRSLEVLAPYGRFVEIGKKDIHGDARVGLLPFRRSLSFTAVDLAAMASEKPAQLAALLREVMACFGDGTYTALPVEVFPASLVADAFRRMARAQHTGKIALRFQEPSAPIAPRSAGSASITGEGTYLITGGLGGLGLTLARWMADEGAQHLALVGRSAPTEQASEVLRALAQRGVDVRVLRGDVARAEDVARVVDEVARHQPPLRGVVHAAAVLADRTVVELEEPQFWAPIRVKVLGAFHLHEATRNLPLDFFVMYSSLASLLGSPGQAAYAAGNAFLDALAHARRAAGLAATSIQWGPFAEVGLAAAKDNRGARLSSQGLESFAPDEGAALFGRVLRRGDAEVGCFRISMRQWFEANPQASGLRFLAELEGEQRPARGAASARAALDQAEPAARAMLVEEHVVEQIGRVLRLAPARIDRRAPFATLGVDSLMSLELRNRLEASLGIRLPAALLFTYATPALLATHLAGALFAALVPQAEPTPTTTPPVDNLGHLDADGLLAALDEELALVRKA